MFSLLNCDRSLFWSLEAPVSVKVPPNGHLYPEPVNSASCFRPDHRFHEQEIFLCIKYLWLRNSIFLPYCANRALGTSFEFEWSIAYFCITIWIGAQFATLKQYKPIEQPRTVDWIRYPRNTIPLFRKTVYLSQFFLIFSEISNLVSVTLFVLCYEIVTIANCGFWRTFWKMLGND